MKKLEWDESDSFWERNELFLDMIQLYRKGEQYENYLSEVALWAERLDGFYADHELQTKQYSFLEQLSAYEGLLQDYVIAEIWGGCLKEGCQIEEIVQVYEWVILTYTTLKHLLFLKWLINEERTLTLEVVKEGVMMISRMAGYGYEDIAKCLQHSFEHTVLEWGQLALLVGNYKL